MTPRPFVSINDWGIYHPASWASLVANQWRTAADIADNWAVMMARVDITEPLWMWAGPGGFNDPDVLEIGKGGMTYQEYKTQVGLGIE